MDQRNVNCLGVGIGVMFIIFGICMLFIGIPLLFESNKDSTLSFITTLCLVSSILLIFGGIQGLKRAKAKDKAIVEYQQSVFEQLAKKTQPQKNESLSQQPSDISVLQNEEKIAEKYTPDIIAHWYYTKLEWKKMTHEERTRRIKEGLWLSPLIGVFGTIILMFWRDAGFFTAVIISFSIGILISFLKIVISNSEFRSRNDNNIVFTTNALIINGTFKTINDMDIHLEYLKLVKHELGDFIEFSIQWLTRGGVTNDQFRILIPEKYKSEAQKIFDYYSGKGVKIETD